MEVDGVEVGSGCGGGGGLRTCVRHGARMERVGKSSIFCGFKLLVLQGKMYSPHFYLCWLRPPSSTSIHALTFLTSFCRKTASKCKTFILFL